MSSLELCERADELCANVHCKFGSDVTATLIEPSASAMIRSVFESKAMLPSRTLDTDASTRMPSSFLRMSDTIAEIFCCALAAKVFRSMVARCSSAL